MIECSALCYLTAEAHHLLAGSAREQRASLNLLKYLANEVKMSVVAVGTSEAPVAFQADTQIHSQFTPFELPRWTDGEEYRRRLVSFEPTLPPRNASKLQQRPLAQFLMAASGGLLGEVRISAHRGRHFDVFPPEVRHFI